MIGVFIFFIFAFVILLGIAVVQIVGQWKVFEKAEKPGWASIIPFYNIIVMLEIGKKPIWWIAMLFVPIANIVFIIMTLNGVSKAFGKDEGYTVGLVFLPFVFWPMLGFSDAKYIYGGNANGSNPDLLDA